MSYKYRGKNLPPLGILLNRLKVPVSTLAKFIHVDASLVSKWKNGQRHLSSYSGHFDKILDFFLTEKNDSFSIDLRARLIDLLREFSPLKKFETTDEIREDLRAFLLERPCFSLPNGSIETSRATSAAKVLIYDGSEGRRNAVADVLDLAEAMTDPGEIIFIECEGCRWLLEDQDYAKQWRSRLYKLLDRGFKAVFILHFTAYHESFFLFFRLCNHLLFHRNLDWYYHAYYDDEIHWFSFFILEHTRSVMGLSMGTEQCDTTVFTDSRSIAQHKRVAEMVKRSSRPLFVDFPQGRLLPSLAELLKPNWLDGTIFSFLPVPLSASTQPDLLVEILQDNAISRAMIRRCLKENRLFEKMVAKQTKSDSPQINEIVTIYQLEAMRRRITDGGFISCSLTLMTGKTVWVTKEQYARSILHVVENMEANPGNKVVLASDEDHIYLPDLNCWCKGKEWMIQMDYEGVRFSKEDVMVRAAYAALEQCTRKIPPVRTQPATVKQMLIKMADELMMKSHPHHKSR